jgi:hypothetical protein
VPAWPPLGSRYVRSVLLQSVIDLKLQHGTLTQARATARIEAL